MASETASLTLTVTLRGTVASTSTTAPGLLPVDYTYEQVFADGTGNNQIGTIYSSLGRALNATNEVLDLDNLTILGTAATDANAVKFILARAKSTTASATLTLGGDDFAAASGPLSASADKNVVGPDGLVLLVSPRDGWGITASTKDGLKVALSDNSTYDVIIGLDNS